MRIGSLQGNDFSIVLRNIDKLYSSFFKDIKKNNFPFLNYYDYQRFGIPGYPSVTHLIGEALINQNFDKAFELYKISGNSESARTYASKEEFFESLDSRNSSFFKNSYSSYIWNKKLESLISKEISSISKDTFQEFSFLFSNDKNCLIDFEKKISFSGF